jgi:hypothetical protein
MSGVSCSSRHSRRSRAATPGGSSAGPRPAPRSSQLQFAPAASGGSRSSRLDRNSRRPGIEAGDDPLAHLAAVGLQFQFAQLMQQIIVQRLGPGDDVGHRVVLAVRHPRPSDCRPAGMLVEVVGQLAVQFNSRSKSSALSCPRRRPAPFPIGRARRDSRARRALPAGRDPLLHSSTGSRSSPARSAPAAP